MRALITMWVLLALGCESGPRVGPRPSPVSPPRASSGSTPKAKRTPTGDSEAEVAVDGQQVEVARAGYACAFVRYKANFQVGYAVLEIVAGSGGSECGLERQVRELSAAVRVVQRFYGLGSLRIDWVEWHGVRPANLPDFFSVSGATRIRRSSACEVASRTGIDRAVNRALGEPIQVFRCDYALVAEGGVPAAGEGAVIERLVFKRGAVLGENFERFSSGLAPPQLDTRMGPYAVRVTGLELSVGSSDAARAPGLGYRFFRSKEEDGSRGILRMPAGGHELSVDRAHLLLTAIRNRAGPAFRIDSISTGGWPEFSERLALAAARAPTWDKRKGAARPTPSSRGQRRTYERVCELINESQAHRGLIERLEGFATHVQCESLEKLFVSKAAGLLGRERCREERVPTWARLPHDAMFYFTAEPVLAPKP